MFFNLEDSVSSDHVAAISLLKSFNRLSFLGHSKDTSKPTSEIEYWTKINRGWRFLVDGTGNAANGKMLPLNLWSEVLERAYRTSNGGPYASTLPGERDPTRDATTVYYLIREGPLFSDQRFISQAVVPKPRKRKR